VPKQQQFMVGFFSQSEPFIAQIWRPKEKDSEECDKGEADKRFKTLRKAMKKGKEVDGLFIASVFIRSVATGDAIRSMTKDGTEAAPLVHDAGMFLATAKLARGQA
jgi:hypothetical protein